MQAHTATRAPGMVNGHAMLEHMLEHAAAEMMINPMELRMNNLMTENSPVLPPPATLDTECIIEVTILNLKRKKKCATSYSVHLMSSNEKITK